MRARRGVSLIEVMVALTLFGLIATVHTVATMRYGLRTRTAALGTARSTAISTAVQLYSTMPRANIATNTGCTTITTIAGFAHTRCVTTTAPTGSITRVRIVITPSNAALRPDTVFVDRVTGAATSVFN
jgi:prepilin-type N-terminal cleavage/methylation domain-containing protein